MVPQVPIVLCLLSLLLAACSVSADRPYCQSDAFLVDRHFESGAFSSCRFLAPGFVELAISPEDAPPINPSPWYAFRISPLQAGELTVRIRTEHGPPRYWPKVSRDGETWQSLDEDRVTIFERDGIMEFTVPTDSTAVWVSAQELYSEADYRDWIQELSTRPFVNSRVIGTSAEGRPIEALQTLGGTKLVLLLGRQHPPEVTGALAMEVFIDTLLADTDLAREFRNRYSVLAVPLMNPDGVAAGHWRHNAQSVDLNRDWGQFTQPETAAVARYLDEVAATGIELALAVDFHSTRDTLFYTQLPEESPWPFDFASVWFANVKERAPDAQFEHAPRSGSGQANAKNYFFTRYSIPSLTYELGDEIGRDEIARMTPVFAEEFMRLLLGR